MPTLDWIGKAAVVNHHREVPTRLLHCDGDLSFGDPDAGNLLVEGDNLEALKALLPFYAGKVKCIYIDPPYNTGNEGWVYNDNVNSPEIRAWLDKVVGKEGEDLSRHDKWLCMMYPRLRLLRDFLTSDGAVFVSIDDTEAGILRLLLDEIFGRDCFMANIAWRSSDNSNNDSHTFSEDHNTIYVYARNRAWVSKKLKRTVQQASHYANPDNDPRGPWFDGNPLGSPSPRPNLMFELVSPQGHPIVPPPKGWRWSQTTIAAKIESGEIRFTADGKGIRRRTYLADQLGVPPSTIWFDLDETGHTRQAKAEQKRLFPERSSEELFPTPKPERLVRRVLQISTDSDDIIMDSFAGSGTTGAAVAQEGEGRHFILVEMLPDVAKNITAQRLSRSEVPFRYCVLGSSLLDEWGSVTEGVTFSDLAAFTFFSETGSPIPQKASEANSRLGVFAGRAVHLLWSAESAGAADARAGNVLTLQALDALAPHDGPRVVYAEGCTVSPERLAAANIVFKQVPYQLGAA